MIVCICKSVRTEDIDNAIEQGASTIEDVRETTGATSCCGKCQFKVNRALHDAGHIELSEVVGSN
jgi:bacterioferritin-associated ferredoxin